MFFRTSNFADYGKLSHQNMDELQFGIRIGVDDRKENDRTLYSGRLRSQEKLIGKALGEQAAQAGILNARRWRANIWVIRSIFTAAAMIAVPAS